LVFKVLREQDFRGQRACRGARVIRATRERERRVFKVIRVTWADSGHRVSRVSKVFRAAAYKDFREATDLDFRGTRDFRVMLVSKDCRDRFLKGLRVQKVFRDCLVVSRDSRDRLDHRGMMVFRAWREQLGHRVRKVFRGIVEMMGCKVFRVMSEPVFRDLRGLPGFRGSRVR
jgi:hypothetical protein